LEDEHALVGRPDQARHAGQRLLGREPAVAAGADRLSGDAALAASRRGDLDLSLEDVELCRLLLLVVGHAELAAFLTSRGDFLRGDFVVRT
ncbi:hypothetical protein DF186_16305, partial [Enterococcus hirae]